MEGIENVSIQVLLRVKHGGGIKIIISLFYFISSRADFISSWAEIDDTQLLGAGFQEEPPFCFIMGVSLQLPNHAQYLPEIKLSY